MTQRRILFTINHAPFGSIHYAEGLRAVVGATSGIDEHEVDVLYLGDGVYFALRGVDRGDTLKYIDTLAKGGRKLNVERESLQERGVALEDLAPDVEVVPRSAIRQLIAQADFTVGF
jgi:sulfur relay (sulfurtransferase) DsrF/TusC family protein